MSYRKHLTSFGLADSRSFDLNMQVRSLHQAVAQLDDRNLELFGRLHPGVIELVDAYAEIEGSGLRRFMEQDELTGLQVNIWTE
jgi:predicted methyltransferase